MKTKNLMIVFAILCLGLFSSSTSLGAWSGAATGDKTKTGTDGICTWTSTLDPEPAYQMSECEWMKHALSAQGFDADGLDDITGNGDDWNVSFAASLTGTIDINEYYAYVGPDCNGGAQLKLDYTSGLNDPVGEAVHWIQVIRTDCPGDYDKAYVAGGYYEYIDNYGNPSGNPYYDWLPGVAGDDWFGDRPLRSCDDCPGCTCCSCTIDWDAQVFLATGNLATRTLTIYEDGVWWGFDLVCVPEPATVLLLGLGGLIMFRRRR